MSNRPSPYTQADITRAVKGAVAAGVKVREIFCSAEGVRLVIAGNDDGNSIHKENVEDVRL